MFPKPRQRLILLVAVVASTIVAVQGWWWLQPLDHSTGLSLWWARVGVGPGLGVLLAVSLPALGLGAVAAAVGHPLAGLFVVAAAWAALACRGGPIDGWMRRADVPTAYYGLVVEAVVWTVLLALAGAATLAARPAVQRGLARVPGLRPEDRSAGEIVPGADAAQAALSGLVCAALSTGVGLLLVNNGQLGQIIGGLLVSFTLGALATQFLFPSLRNPLGMLLSPLIVAVGAYLYAVWFHPQPAQLLGAWYSRSLTGLALALPAHYASLGVAGVIMGIGWAQALIRGAKAAPSPAG